MRKYETIVVLSPELNDSQIKQELKKFETVITSKGGQNFSVDPWGKKDLAHPAKKFASGRYVCLNYETSDYGTVESLNGLLRLSDSVLKHQSHKLSSKVRKYKGNPKKAMRGGVEFDDGDSMEAADSEF
ncbi:MAG: 30S ribosomal protein S6 [Deltaproteobacteria bacterium]|nr:30S ribosomal protein S6 [Deltaproteobacteria bacterium]